MEVGFQYRLATITPAHKLRRWSLSILLTTLAVTFTAHSSGASGTFPGRTAFDLANIKDQTIDFPALTPKTFGDAPFDITATASSGLDVTFTSAGHCTVTASTVHLTGPGSCTLTASQDGDANFNAAPNVKQSFFIAAVGEQLFDMRSFGATGDGVTDDGPALQAALDAVATARGGTVVIPEGRYALETPVSKNFAGTSSKVTIRGIESDTVVDTSGGGRELAQGLDLPSEILPRTEDRTALDISGLEKFMVSDVAFVGTPDVLTDAAITLNLTDITDATINHCEFYGLRTLVPGGAIVLAKRSGLRVEHSKFLGSFAATGWQTSNVQNIEWKSIAISNVIFIDWGLRPDFYCKCQDATFSWINVGNAAAVTADSPRREASIRDVFLDENAYLGLTSRPAYYQPASAPIDLLYISRLRMNVSNFGTTGNYLSQLEGLLIADSNYGWSTYVDSAINLLSVENAIVDRTECLAAADKISADAATNELTLINSTYAQLNSAAHVTRELMTAPEDDPVQYVQTSFQEALARDPDPAAHFYWSNRLLRCADDLQCVSTEKEALANYLSSAPQANISIAGRIADAAGAPMANVTVTLSGSQAVTAQTDANGSYSFSALPSSATYSLTPMFPDYTFGPASTTVTTPSADQTVNFNATLNSYLISGRVMDSAGDAITGATVNLSGSRASSTVSDATGAYAFSVPTLGSYTVTATKPHYDFLPAAISFNNINGPRSADFIGTLVNYELSGQVTVDGAPLAGVTIDVTGKETATVTTDASGNYSLTVAAGDYVLTPSKAHYSFNPQVSNLTNIASNRTANFTASLYPHTISGQILNAASSGVAGVTVSLTGTQTTCVVTGPDGGFSFANVPAGGDYTVTAARSDYTFEPGSYAFTDLSADQNMQFSGNPPAPELVTEPSESSPDEMLALSSILQLAGPFTLHRSSTWLDLGTDVNRRLVIFADHITFESGESPGAVIVNLFDANNQSFDIPADDVRLMLGSDLKQVIFRLPDNLAVGTCRMKITLRGQSSNTGTFRVIQ